LPNSAHFVLHQTRSDFSSFPPPFLNSINQQEDAQRLAVRVAQLEKEKAKSDKRITETRKRATVIHQYRKRNEEHKIFKETLVKEREQEIMEQAKVLQETKAESVKRREESSRALEEAKREINRRAKDERESNERYLEEQRVLDRKAAMEAKEEVKRQQLEQAQRAAMMKQKHLDSARENYEQRLQKEVEQQQEKEKDLARMSKMELELIEQLQKKQEEQRAAYEELETALLGTTGGGARGGGRAEGVRGDRHRGHRRHPHRTAVRAHGRAGHHVERHATQGGV
jgi:hypothetical protein